MTDNVIPLFPHSKVMKILEESFEMNKHLFAGALEFNYRTTEMFIKMNGMQVKNKEAEEKFKKLYARFVGEKFLKLLDEFAQM